MELRVLRYFLEVAKEQSFTKAAGQLHITQPTLSRQLAMLEEELGTLLFERNGHGVTLTEDGQLLKRRAMEMVELEDKIKDDFKSDSEIVEGSVVIGCGEFNAVETLAEVCKRYKDKYPKVQIRLHTATADVVHEMMDKGLVDIGLFLEPTDTEGLDYIRLENTDRWIVSMRPDDPLAEKAYITKEDLKNKPLIFPERTSVQSELINWFGEEYKNMNVSFTSNLGTNAAIFVNSGLGYSVSIEGAGKYWREDLIVQKRLFPEIKPGTVIAWKRNIPYSVAVKKMIEEL
ncbi:MAG: LysR family transcriptional regulator, partial [Clostridiales bacterium]|nr:LysR family transcriptional regulator [Candidatus Blautia equi]